MRQGVNQRGEGGKGTGETAQNYANTGTDGLYEGEANDRNTQQ